MVEYSPTSKRHRLRANYCGDRFCVPCARSRSRKIEGALVKSFGGKQPLFMTLTIRSSDRTLAQCLDHLYASFKRLRRSKWWRKNVRGGVLVTEIKLGAGSGRWHVHGHALVEAHYLDVRRLSEEWHRATGDSFIVDVSRVRKDTRGIGYVAKYASKGWTADVVRNPEALLECVVSLRGRRLLVTFGTFAKLDVDGDSADPGDWRRIGRLDHVLHQWAAGEPWAVAVVRSLNVEGMLEEVANCVDPPG